MKRVLGFAYFLAGVAGVAVALFLLIKGTQRGEVAIWAKQFDAQAAVVSVSAIAADASRVFVATVERVKKSATGATKLTSTIAAYTTNGERLWKQTLVGSPETFVTDMTVSNQALVIAGWFRGDLKLGESTTTAQGKTDSFVAVLNARNGKAITVRTLSGVNSSDSVIIYAITATTRTLYAGGTLKGRLVVGSYATKSLERMHGFLAGFTLDSLRPTNLLGLSGKGVSFVKSVAAFEDSVIVAGEFRKTVGIASVELQGNGCSDIFLARLNSALQRLDWAKAFGDRRCQYVSSVAINPKSIYVGGYFEGVLDLGCAPMSVPSEDDSDGFVARFDPNGRCVWARRFSGAMGQRIYDVTATATTVFATGGAWDSLVVGVQSCASSGYQDVFVSALRAESGEPMALECWGDGNDQYGYRIATQGDRVVLGGTFSGTLRFEPTELKAHAASAGFLALLKILAR